MDVLVTTDNPLDRRCTATSKQSGERCKRIAKPGYKVCHYHGAGGGRPIVHGLYSRHLSEQPDLAERIEALRNDPRLLDSTNYLAMLVACFERLLESISSAKTLEKEDLDSVVKVTDVASKIVERHYKQASGYWLTPEQQEIWLKQLVAVINKRVPDNEIKQLIANDMAALPTVKG